MAKKGETKFCPKCGAEVKADDNYCTTCRYNFEQRKKKRKLGFKKIIAIIIILIIIFLAVRYFTGKPLIPDLSFIKNLTSFGK